MTRLPQRNGFSGGEAAAIGPPLARRRSRARAALLRAMFAPLARLVLRDARLGTALTGAGTPADSRPSRRSNE